MDVLTVPERLFDSGTVRLFAAAPDPFLANGPEAARLRSLLPPAVRERLDLLRRPEDLARSLTAYSLLFGALERLTGSRVPKPGLAVNRFGKPFLRDPYGLHFNCAHAGGWALCALARHPVGADIERSTGRPDYTVLSVCHPDEARFVMSFEEPARTAAFYRFWTRKEAYLKALGTGLSRGLDSFSISESEDGSPSIHDSDRPAKLVPAFRTLGSLPGFTVSVCVLLPAAAAPAEHRSTDLRVELELGLYGVQSRGGAR